MGAHDPARKSRRKAGSSPPSERSLSPPSLAVFNGVFDVCVANKLTVELQWFDEAFTLEVLDKKRTVAIASTRRLGAAGIRGMAEQIRIQLERSKRLTD